MNPVDIQILLDAIEKSNYNSKGKEVGLLKSMKECIDTGKWATGPQAKFLNDIYGRAYGGGDYQDRGYFK